MSHPCCTWSSIFCHTYLVELSGTAHSIHYAILIIIPSLVVCLLYYALFYVSFLSYMHFRWVCNSHCQNHKFNVESYALPMPHYSRSVRSMLQKTWTSRSSIRSSSATLVTESAEASVGLYVRVSPQELVLWSDLPGIIKLQGGLCVRSKRLYVPPWPTRLPKAAGRVGEWAVVT